MFRRYHSINSELARLLSRNLPASAQPNPAPSGAETLTALEQFDHQQRAQLEQFKHHQAVERQREISRQNQMSTRLAAESPSNPTPPRQSQPAPAQDVPTHITAQPKPPAPLPPKTQPSPLPIPLPASPAVSTVAHSKNVTSPVSPQATSQRTAGNSTVQAGNLAPSPVASHLSTAPPSASQASSIPQNVHQNSSASQSLAQPSGVESSQNQRHGMSTGQKVLLAGGIVSAIFVLGYFVRWLQKRRHHQLSSPRKVDKLHITGPFKKSEENMSDTDSEPIFGGTGHASISFDRLQVLSEKPVNFPRADIYNQPNLPYPPPKSPSASASSLTIEPPQSQPNPLPNLKLISPLAQFNDQTPLDYRCKGPEMKGKIFLVERTYQAALADELVLHVGDRIEVAFYYDDGWCLGQNLDIDRYEAGQLAKGVFPRDCVGAQPVEFQKGPEASSATNERASHRTSCDEADEQSRKAFRTISSNPSLSPLSSSIFEKFPLPPRSNNRLEAQQRVSSLFIGRNAQLFLELDDALGDPTSSPHVHFDKTAAHPK
ncbi:hypothetical protein PtB15_11B167 [Puccinia triticina]|nr:hypothetical protein PtB15_11B167 [Puccinia triticina]